MAEKSKNLYKCFAYSPLMARITRVLKLEEETHFCRFRYELGKKTPLRVESEGYNSFSVPQILLGCSPVYISEFIENFTIADLTEDFNLTNNPEKTLEARIHLGQAAPQLIQFDGKIYGKVLLPNGGVVYEADILHSPNPKRDYLVGENIAFRYSKHLGFMGSDSRFQKLIRGNKKSQEQPSLTFFRAVADRQQNIKKLVTVPFNLPLFLLTDIEKAITPQ